MVFSAPSLRCPRFVALASLPSLRNTCTFRERGMMSRAFRFATVLSFAPLASFAAPAASSASVESSVVSFSTNSPAIWNWDIQGRRITAMCEDARGRVFAASEENGVWMRGRGGAWSGYLPKNSSIASDMIYVLACDQQGRIWAGTARHGVSVFNGR